MSKELIMSLLNAGFEGLVDTFKAVPDDRLKWIPGENGRSPIDLFGEVAQTCTFSLKVIQSPGEAKLSSDLFKQWAQERAAWSREDALRHFETNSKALLAAVQAIPEEDLAKPVTLSLRSEVTHPLGYWVMMMYRSSISRYAQINYVQRLYGDMEMH